MNWAAKGTHLNERPKTVIERGLVPYCSSHHIEDLGVVVRVRAVAINTAWEERLTQLLLLDVLDEFAGNTPVEIVCWVGRGCKGVGGRLCLGMRMSWCAGVVEDTLLRSSFRNAVSSKVNFFCPGKAVGQGEGVVLLF